MESRLAELRLNENPSTASLGSRFGFLTTPIMGEASCCSCLFCRSVLTILAATAVMSWVGAGPGAEPGRESTEEEEAVVLAGETKDLLVGEVTPNLPGNGGPRLLWGRLWGSVFGPSTSRWFQGREWVLL